MNNNKIVSTTKSSAIFLAIVLVTGTIALYFPSFMTTPANAQSEPPYYYETDEYTGYPMDRMANGYNVDEEYNSQSTYYNDNNYKDSNGVDIKKIKCNNINSNLNGLESSTDLNSLLGLESATAHGNEEGGENAYGNNGYKNNGNFDIDCINTNDNEGGQDGAIGPQGPQGPAGEQGPTGEAGPQGPSGFNTINSTNLYQVQGNVAPAGSVNEIVTSTAICDTGDIVFNGIENIAGSGSTIIRALNEDIPTSGTYVLTVFGNSLSLRADAQCLDNPPLRP